MQKPASLETCMAHGTERQRNVVSPESALLSPKTRSREEAVGRRKRRRKKSKRGRIDSFSRRGESTEPFPGWFAAAAAGWGVWIWGGGGGRRARLGAGGGDPDPTPISPFPPRATEHNGAGWGPGPGAFAAGLLLLPLRLLLFSLGASDRGGARTSPSRRPGKE